MTTLIICIDRDNDIGEKAGIESPIIGRAANIQAAISLGVTDPEDSDTNSILGAVNVYDNFTAKGNKAEIVTIGGDKKIGLESDTKIMMGLSNVIKRLKPENGIMVTDGAEDEGLLNLIQSKIDIIGLERITVRQEKKIEGIYYYIQKAIEDEKMRSVVLPISMILMAWGISFFFDLEGVMKGFIIFLAGSYLLMKTYHLEGEINKIYGNVMDEIQEGKLSWVFSTISVLVLFVGFFRALDYLRGSEYFIEHGFDLFEVTLFIYILMLIDSIILWIVVSLLVKDFGSYVDQIIHARTDDSVEAKEFFYYLKNPIFIISTGLFLKAGIKIVQFMADDSSIDFVFLNTMSMIILGIFLFIGGRQLYEEEEEELKTEKSGHFPHFKRKKKLSGWRH